MKRHTLAAVFALTAGAVSARYTIRAGTVRHCASRRHRQCAFAEVSGVLDNCKLVKHSTRAGSCPKPGRYLP